MALRPWWSPDRPWVTSALLAVIVLAPAVCVFWFMNAAMASQAAAARQEVMGVYREQLRIIRNQVHAHWSDTAASLDRVARMPPSEAFAELITSGRADSAIILDEQGRMVFPPTSVPADESKPAALSGALRTAAAVRASGPLSQASGLTRTPVDGVWQLRSGTGRVVGLFTEATVHESMHRVIDGRQSESVRFALFAPDEGAYEDAIAVGPSLPGWQASFALLDTSVFERTAQARRTSYLWAGMLALAVIAAAGAGAAWTLRRQARLARLRTDMVAALSHELRAPVASMQVLVDGLLADRRPDARKTREYLALMASENTRLARLVENFLAFSRVERSRGRLTFIRTDPCAVAQAAVASVAPHIDTHCDIELEVDEGLPPLEADPDALGIALRNLLDNAFKYTTAEKRIRVRVFRDNGDVVFAVEDNGIGIPAAEQKRIFRRFYRVDRRLSQQTSGVGLGLTIVHEVVRAHRGEVRVASRPGAGSTFSLRLPYRGEVPA